jgi:2-haloacid dehalogenase
MHTSNKLKGFFMEHANNHHPAIIFDFGGVLMDWNPRYLYRKLFNGDEEGMEQFFNEVDFFAWNLRQDEGRPFSEAVAELCVQFPTYSDLIQAYDTRFEETLSGPIQPTVEILRLLHEAGYPLYALSNWSMEKFEIVRPKYEFFNWFKTILISGAVKMVKPDPQIFSLLLQQINHSAEECLIIDDSTKNISTASQLGFRTIHYRSSEQLKQELQKIGLL